MTVERENVEVSDRDNDRVDDRDDRANQAGVSYKALDGTQKNIIQFCSVPRSAREILEHIGYTNGAPYSSNTERISLASGSWSLISIGRIISTFYRTIFAFCRLSKSLQKCDPALNEVTEPTNQRHTATTAVKLLAINGFACVMSRDDTAYCRLRFFDIVFGTIPDYRIKLVRKGLSNSGCPSSLTLSLRIIQAMLRASVRIVCIPSSSCAACPGV